MRKPAHARGPVDVGVHGDARVLSAPAGTLPDALPQAAQRDVQAGQVTAAPAPLRGALPADRLPGHEPGRAVPQGLVLDEFADRFRDNPSGPGEVTKDRVLIRQVRRVARA